MQGRFQRVEGRPEVGALVQSALGPETRFKATDVINARTLALMKHLLDNLNLIREATDALRAGDNATTQKLNLELDQRFEPNQTRDPLMEPLTQVLPPFAEVEMKSAPKATRQAVEQRLIYDLYQQELRLANEYTLRPIQQKLERIYEAAVPTPEQRKKLARTIYHLLDEERRLKLVTAAISSY
jgi:hypothetical protein